jgi:hypothetical protein
MNHPSVFRWPAVLGSALVMFCSAAWGDVPWETYATYEWPRVLSEDPAPGHSLVAAFVSTLPDVQAWQPGRFYESALAEKPGDPMTLYSLATWCFYSPDQVVCLDGDVLQTLADADPENGTPLVMLAVRELVRGEDDQALLLLERAASSKTLDGYWGQMVGLLARTINETVPESMGNPIALATGLAAARPMIETNIHDVCTTPAAKLLERKWNQVCVLLGRAFEERATTLLMAQMGVSIQRHILKMRTEEEELEALEVREAALHELGNVEDLTGEALERYWADLALYGELEALRRAAGPVNPEEGG